VASPGQELPQLPPTVRVVRDRRPDRGPLEGIRAGLEALGEQGEAAYVTGCDVPLLVAGFVRRMIELAAGFDAAVPHVDGYDEPLAAVYRTGVLAHIEALLAADLLRPAFLFDRVRTRRITADELTDVDPGLESLANVNSPADYLAALARAGLEVPDDVSPW
jgi:molybdopterin-guanine dinucleotide biosynthesis protein A